MKKNRKKIYSLKNLKKIIESHKKQDKKVVFTNGCFDILHAGHLSYLKKAASLGDILVIGLNSDSSIQKIKGPKRPLVPEKERAFALSCLEFVDYVVIFNEENPVKLISVLLPNILVKGADYKKKDILGADIVETNGGKVSRVALIKGRSTTQLIKNILEKYKNESIS